MTRVFPGVRFASKTLLATLSEDTTAGLAGESCVVIQQLHVPQRSL